MKAIIGRNISCIILVSFLQFHVRPNKHRLTCSYEHSLYKELIFSQ